jgi:glycosyltransferase involved in cell wall biosynthesis
VGLLDGTLPAGPSGEPPVLHEDPPQDRMHAELARRGAYVHPCRWTSLGLSLLEAMAMGMPVAALAATDAWRAVPPGTGLLAASGPGLAAAARRLLDDPVLAADLGAAAAAHTARRYGLRRFLQELDEVLDDVAPAVPVPAGSPSVSSSPSSEESP